MDGFWGGKFSGQFRRSIPRGFEKMSGVQQAESAALAVGGHGIILRLRLGEARLGRAIQKTHRNSESGPGCACVDRTFKRMLD